MEWEKNMEKNEKSKVNETGAVTVPVVSKAVADASSEDIAQVITKKKHRFFDRSRRLEDHTIEELEILKKQKIEEERLAGEKAVDEATVAELRAMKHSFYDHYRRVFCMEAPYDARLTAFFVRFIADFKAVGIKNKRALPVIQEYLDLYGLKVVDAKHVFTDKEFERLHERLKVDSPGVPPAFLLFKNVMREQIRNVAPSDMLTPEGQAKHEADQAKIVRKREILDQI